MAEGSELMNRLMSENADLKKQVRLLKENQMLKRLLNESCQDSCGRGSRDLLFPKAPTYPEACSPGNGGEAQALPGQISSPYEGLERPANGATSNFLGQVACCAEYPRESLSLRDSVHT